MIVHGNYRLSWWCSHPPHRLRLLGNGEMACDDCMHVAVRRDGTPVVWSSPLRGALSPNPVEALAELITRAGGEVDAERVSEAAAVCDAPIQVVKPEDLTAEIDAVILGAPPKEETL